MNITQLKTDIDKFSRYILWKHSWFENESTTQSSTQNTEQTIEKVKSVLKGNKSNYPKSNTPGPLTLLGLTFYFYTKAWGGMKIHPPLKIDLFLKKNMFYHHEVNFCINSALFWCIALFSSSILANFSNFIEKKCKIWNF